MAQPGKNKKHASESAQTAKRTLHFYWQTTRKMRPTFWGAFAATIGFVFFLSYANPYLMGVVVDKLSENAGQDTDLVATFGPCVAGLLLVNLLGQVCSKLQDWTTWKLEIFAKYDLATTVFDALSNQSMTFHVNRRGGSLVSQTTKFLDAYERLFELFMYNLVPIAASVLFTVAFVFVNIPLFGVILLVLLVGYLALVVVMYKRVLPINAKSAAASNMLSGELSDSVTNIVAVKTCGREAYERKLFREANDNVRAAERKRMRVSMERGITTSAILVVIMAVLSIFIVGGNTWFGVSAGTLVAVFSYTYSMTTQLNRLNMTLQGINGGFGNAYDMTVILDEPRLVSDAEDATDLKVERGEIDFSHVDFTYWQEASLSGIEAGSEADSQTACAQTSDQFVFRDFNLHIPPGQRVGIVGKSGSGKTTLTSVLLRLADVQGGVVSIDGQDISRVTQTSLRHNIAYVPQEPLLFHRSVGQNIAYGNPEASPEQIRRAAELANALDFIEENPLGFDVITGERGIKLSGGQRQRVAIARAILEDAPILVLDEATSSLDSESEAQVQGALINLMKGRTCIVVAHRLSTVASLDRFVVIDEGHIVEDGSHAELLAAGGMYAHLWNLQTGMLASED